MYKKISTGTIVFLAIAIGIITIIAVIYNNEQKMANDSKVADGARLPDSIKLTHLDSLPYYQYKPIADSIKNLADNEKTKNTLIPVFFPVGTGFMSFIRTARYWYGWYTDNKSHMIFDHFLALPHYTLDDNNQVSYNDGKFFMENAGKKQEIKTYYLPETKRLLIPLSQKVYNIGMITTLVLMGIILLGLLYIIIALPFNVLRNISRGQVFTAINLRDLKLVAYTLLGIALIELIMPFVLYLFFNNQIAPEFHLSFADILSSEWDDILIGLIILAISKAFSRGYRLQQENDLTI